MGLFLDSNLFHWSVFLFLCQYYTVLMIIVHLSVNPLGTMPTRSPSVVIPSKAIGLPGIMFATLGVSPAGCLCPNPYHPSPKVTNIPLDQISTPLLWNIWSIAS